MAKMAGEKCELGGDRGAGAGRSGAAQGDKQVQITKRVHIDYIFLQGQRDLIRSLQPLLFFYILDLGALSF
jgi:hypothetical protein